MKTRHTLNRIQPRLGLQQGRKEALKREIDLVLRQIKKRFGKSKKFREKQIRVLPIESVEELGEALLEFKTSQDLKARLERLASEN